MKESGLILLQTIPASIDIEVFKAELTGSFKDIVNVHDLHIWQLTANKYICTAHIIFETPEDFSRVRKDVNDFFVQQGITHVTIQPEFITTIDGEIVQKPGQTCLVQCRDKLCRVKHCCKANSLAPSSKSSLCPSTQVSIGHLPELAEVVSVQTESDIALKDVSKAGCPVVCPGCSVACSESVSATAAEENGDLEQDSDPGSSAPQPEQKEPVKV